jgi:ABC-type bacteriocin/lantibiotic exporter with double-glycine peptidase domain
MNAAERIYEYSKLTVEPQEGQEVPASWPTEGKLVFQDLVVGYASDLPPVLHGLSFSVEKNERLGVVGRTGAGKSSLTLAIFRFLEARSGNITIDGIDISKIKLVELRSRLTIIPQDPALFSGRLFFVCILTANRSKVLFARILIPLINIAMSSLKMLCNESSLCSPLKLRTNPPLLSQQRMK